MPEAAQSHQGNRARQQGSILENAAAGLLLLTTILVFVAGGAWLERSSPSGRRISGQWVGTAVTRLRRFGS